MHKNIYAISDIHGRGDEFEILLHKLSEELKNSQIILLGDYIGYGKNNLKVISLIKKLKEENDVIVLKGNWEDMFYTTVKKSTSLDPNDEAKINAFKSRGGNRILRELHKDTDLLEYFLSLIENMEPCYYDESNKILFVHAGVDFRKLKMCHGNLNLFFDLQEEEDLIWNFDFYPTVVENSDMISKMPFSIVTGHIPISMLDPNKHNECFTFADKVICIDFGASRKNGQLGIVNILDKHKKAYTQDIL